MGNQQCSDSAAQVSLPEKKKNIPTEEWPKTFGKHHRHSGSPPGRRLIAAFLCLQKVETAKSATWKEKRLPIAILLHMSPMELTLMVCWKLGQDIVTININVKGLAFLL